MQITTETTLTFLGSLSLSLTITPTYMFLINKLNNVIRAKAKQPQTLLEFAKVGVGAVVMTIIFVLPLELITRNISNQDLAKDCISFYMGTYAFCFITSLLVLRKAGRIQTIWKKPS